MFLGLSVIHNKYIQKREISTKQEIQSAGDLYKSNLSENLSITASSTIFLDYLRSGPLSRKNLYYRFLTQISLLQLPSVSGMKILDAKKNLIFQHGKITNECVSLKLCYLNQHLNTENGDCNFTWQLYFNNENLLKSIQAINSNIKLTNDGSYIDLASGNYFSSFPLDSGSILKLKIGINDNNDHFFYVYLFLMSVGFLIFGSWSWYRLSSTLNNYVANPIKNLTNCLKENNSLIQTNNIHEIEYLISEINTWKHKLNKMQADEHIEKLGKIAAQLAHDVRSPLSAIDMLVKNLINVPENYRITLCHATQRISDIANNFLIQYKNPQSCSLTPSLSNEHISNLLDNIISEKRSQYTNRDINIILTIEENAKNAFSFINAVDFKRVLSNLINNSIEAICASGQVHVKLIKLENFLKIKIIDTGSGISTNLLPKIILGGSFGKKGGSGLGLTHAIKKIEEWHGNLDINSKIGIGTKICITLPLAKENTDTIFNHLKSSSIEC
jgi:signal transduction histidine kinase